ncbi:MAG: SRPBCC family protein [Bacteroidetes bacterium]|nr:SRPBCC family protein [Bacteroidota bacterium]
MKKFREVKINIEVESSKARVWDTLFNNFGDVSAWNPLVEDSHHSGGSKGEVGCERVCDLDSKTTIHERISSSNGTDSFDVDIIKGGLPMMDKGLGRFELEELSDERTRINFIIKFTAKPSFMGGIMKLMMPKMLIQVLVGLKYHLETGNLVDKSNIKRIMKNYKQLDSDQAFSTSALLEVAA